ncbi:unnamed protein product [Amaranthus hypochondriacus]
MESDLSLLDDSLLQQLPPDDISTFTCSPLQLPPKIPKSHSTSSPLSLSSINTNSKKVNPCDEIQGTNSIKENLHNNDKKSIGHNLSLEPQRMKRSKKAGGYNLRKSLAWDKAFFTEEGVLNDSELSMISGIIADPDSLSVKDQHEQDSFTVNYGSISGSTDGGNSEDMFEDLPSSYPNKKIDTISSSMKHDSLNGGSFASASKSSRKVSPSRDLKRVLCKGEVGSSPMTSVSQKRLLNSGTRQKLTRNSKIPKVPVSKKSSCVPPMTPIRIASSLKCTESVQPAPRTSLSSDLSSKPKQAYGAAKLLEHIPKSIKPCAGVGNNMTNLNPQMHSLMSHKAQHSTKERKSSENNSSQRISTDETNMVKSRDTTALSHVHSFNAGSSGRNPQVHGIKPSGLRMPSPSLRFFSETKASVSNTLPHVNSRLFNLFKSNIPTSRKPEVAGHIHDFKPTQPLQGSPDVDSIGKEGPCIHNKDKFSTSSIVVPKVHAKNIQYKCNQETVELQVPQKDNNLEQTSKQFRYNDLDAFQNPKTDQAHSSLMVEEKGVKNGKSNTFHEELKETNAEATIHFQETRTADKCMLDDYHESYSEVYCETKTEAQSRISEDVELKSSISNNDVSLDSQTNSDSHHNNLMLVYDSNPSSSMCVDDETSGDRNSCGLDCTDSHRTIEMQLVERDLLANGFSSKLDVDHFAALVCTGGILAVQDTISTDEVCVPDQFDSNLSSVKLSEESEQQVEAIKNYESQKRQPTNAENSDNKDLCMVNLEVVELFKHSASTSQEFLNEESCEFVHLCKSNHGEDQPQHSNHGIVDNCASANDASVAYHHFTENIEDMHTEVDKQTILSIKLSDKEMMLQSSEADICSRLLLDSSGHINEEKGNATSSDVLDQVSNSLQEVKDPTSLLSCLPNESSIHTTPMEFQSFGIKSKEHNDAANLDNVESFCPINEHEFSPKDVLISATVEESVDSEKDVCNQSSIESKTDMPQHVDTLRDKITYNTEDIEDNNIIIEKMTDDQKLMRPPPDAVPFSDEWLAAIESAGEEILTLKTGAVKHSPPDKSVPEPSPWSPVKRKNNQVIGPFDCTKYTNS